MTDTPTTDLLVKEPQMPYQDLVDMVTKFQDQLQSLDYRVTNKNFGSKFYQTKETINSKARFIAGAADDVVIMDAQHPLYRLWVGTEDPATAPFRVDKNGNTTITSITLSGYVATGGSLADIGIGNITGTYIASGSITTPKLSATAIDGMTITGAEIRTSSSGARVLIDGSADTIYIYDASAKRMQLDNDEISFYNSSGAKLGGISTPTTTNLTLKATTGNYLVLDTVATSGGLVFSIAGTQKMAITNAGIQFDGDLTFSNAYDINDVDEIYFRDNSVNPSTAGQFHYYNTGGVQEYQGKAGTFVGSFDMTAT